MPDEDPMQLLFRLSARRKRASKLALSPSHGIRPKLELKPLQLPPIPTTPLPSLPSSAQKLKEICDSNPVPLAVRAAQAALRAVQLDSGTKEVSEVTPQMIAAADQVCRKNTPPSKRPVGALVGKSTKRLRTTPSAARGGGGEHVRRLFQDGSDNSLDGGAGDDGQGDVKQDEVEQGRMLEREGKKGRGDAQKLRDDEAGGIENGAAKDAKRSAASSGGDDEENKEVGVDTCREREDDDDAYGEEEDKTVREADDKATPERYEGTKVKEISAMQPKSVAFAPLEEATSDDGDKCVGKKLRLKNWPDREHSLVASKTKREKPLHSVVGVQEDKPLSDSVQEAAAEPIRCVYRDRKEKEAGGAPRAMKEGIRRRSNQMSVEVEQASPRNESKATKVVKVKEEENVVPVRRPKKRRRSSLCRELFLLQKSTASARWTDSRKIEEQTDIVIISDDEAPAAGTKYQRKKKKLDAENPSAVSRGSTEIQIVRKSPRRRSGADSRKPVAKSAKTDDGAAFCSEDTTETADLEDGSKHVVRQKAPRRTSERHKSKSQVEDTSVDDTSTLSDIEDNYEDELMGGMDSAEFESIRQSWILEWEMQRNGIFKLTVEQAYEVLKGPFYLGKSVGKILPEIAAHPRRSAKDVKRRQRQKLAPEKEVDVLRTDNAPSKEGMVVRRRSLRLSSELL